VFVRGGKREELRAEEERTSEEELEKTGSNFKKPKPI
jgi:hypothetical protein